MLTDDDIDNDKIYPCPFSAEIMKYMRTNQNGIFNYSHDGKLILVLFSLSTGKTVQKNISLKSRNKS